MNPDRSYLDWLNQRDNFPPPERKSQRMETDTLREKVGMAVHDYACGCERPWPPVASYTEIADAVLVALGLDDLDAAVVRGANRLLTEKHSVVVGLGEGAYKPTGVTLAYRQLARTALEAALTATEPHDG